MEHSTREHHLPIRAIKLENLKAEGSHLETEAKEDIKRVLLEVKNKLKGETKDTSLEKLVPFDGPPQHLSIQSVQTKRRQTVFKKFKCDMCNRRIGTKGGLIYHMKAHINGRPFKCDICRRTYATKNDYNTHFQRHQSASFKCDFCAKSFRVKQYLADHIAGLHLPKVISCVQCKRLFSCEGILKKHIMLYHNKNKSKPVAKYGCKLCGINFVIREHYLQHCKRREELKYECTLCSKRFPCRKLWARHRAEENKKDLFCQICQKIVGKLKEQNFGYHGNYNCKMCNEFSTEISSLFQAHRKKCGTEKQIRALGFDCAICNLYFKTLKKRQDHMNDIHGKLKCPKCGKTFYAEKTLQLHIKHHKRRKDTTFYKCILCPNKKIFSRKETFDAHFRAQHSGHGNRSKDIPYRVCDKCNHKSIIASNFLSHISKCYKI